MTKLLLDIDPGCDDSIATLMALASEEIEVVGLTTVAGNTTVANTTANALAIREFADRSDVPVAQGSASPIDDELVKAEWIHGPGGLPASVRDDLLVPDASPIESHAVDFIIEQAHEHGEELTIAGVGPATNLALALLKDPTLPDRVGDIYLMGGALKTTGNVTPRASFNFYVDAIAASRVVRSGSPKVVGLDVTEPAYVPMDQIEAFAGQSQRLDTVLEILSFTEEEVREKFGNEGVIASDAVIVADLITDVLSFEESYIEIDTSLGPSRGGVVYDEHGLLEEPPNAEVALDIDLEAYRNCVVDFLETV